MNLGDSDAVATVLFLHRIQIVKYYQAINMPLNKNRLRSEALFVKREA